MTELKKQNVDKCFSLLREFIDEADSRNGKKGNVRLALEQLQRITAGATDENSPSCTDYPRAIGEPVTALSCTDYPRAIGEPVTASPCTDIPRALG